jgi:hypothetical protein
MFTGLAVDNDTSVVDVTEGSAPGICTGTSRSSNHAAHRSIAAAEAAAVTTVRRRPCITLRLLT